MFGAKSISKLFLGSMLLIMPAGSFAYVDDAGIMDHFNYANDQCLYDYLNQNDYMTTNFIAKIVGRMRTLRRTIVFL